MNTVLSAFLDEKVKGNKYLISSVKLNTFNEGLDLLKNGFYSDIFNGYSNEYHTSKVLKDELMNEPLFCMSSVGYNGSLEDVWDLLNHNCLTAVNIDPEILDQAMVDYCFSKEPCLIYFLDKKFQTTQNVLGIIKKEPLLLEFVREDLKTYKLCNLAFKLDKRIVKYTPKELIDDAIIHELKAEKELYLLNYIPSDFWDNELITTQMVINPRSTVRDTIHEYLLINDISGLKEMVDSVVNNRDLIDLKNIDPVIYQNHSFMSFIYAYYDVNPDILSVLNIQTAPTEIHNLMVRTGYLDNWGVNDIPERLWRNSYNVIYESKSILAYKYPKKLESVPAMHKDYWLKNWIELKKSNFENLPDLPSFLVTKKAIEDADTFAEIYETRLSTQIMMNGDITVEGLSKLNPSNVSIDELNHIKVNIPQEVLTELQKKDSFWFAVKIEDNSINKVEALRFATDYPNLTAALPTNILEDDEFVEQLATASPKAHSYLLRR